MEADNDVRPSSSPDERQSLELARIAERLLIQSADEVFSSAVSRARLLPSNDGRSFSELFGVADELRMHGVRTAVVARAMALHLALPAADIALLQIAAIVHDVGKLLADQEKFYVVDRKLASRTHPSIGRDLITESFFSEPYLTGRIAEIVYSHHERWDGLGFPRRLVGNEIPVLARVLAVADTFDALVSPRSYKAAMPLEFAIEQLRLQRGVRFEPRCVDAFEVVIRQLQRNARSMR